MHRGGREEAAWEAGEAGSGAMCRVSRAGRRHGQVLGLGTRCRGATSVSHSLLPGILPAEKDSNPCGIERATDSGTRGDACVWMQDCWMEAVRRNKQTRKAVCDCKTQS